MRNVGNGAQQFAVALRILPPRGDNFVELRREFPRQPPHALIRRLRGERRVGAFAVFFLRLYGEFPQGTFQRAYFQREDEHRGGEHRRRTAESDRHDVIDRKVVINETEAKIAQRIFTEYANGKRLLTLAEELKADGIVNKKGVPFSPESMYYMLHLERYAGRYTVNGILYDNIFPRIIPEEIFQQVQKRLEANRHGKHVPGVEYILKGKLFCECGNPMRSAGGKSRGKKQYRYYRCFSARRVKGCKDKTFRKDILENLVVSALVDQVTTEKNLNFLTERLLIKLQQDTAEAQTLKTLEKALAQTNKSLSNLLKAIENGIFSDTTKTRLDELETQKKALTEKLLIEKNKERSVPTTDEIKKYLKYAIQKTPRNLVELLVEKIIVYMDKIEIFLKYHGEPHTTPPHNDNNPDGTDNSDRGFLITEFLTTNLTSSEYYTYKKWAKREFLIRILL
ncbi:MAG TPA: recombinase family protein [Candidatus Borkfalkia excrementigallinarum]|uniref:Recombinase family protein n=1 Tax=Candidatus Borkfalkia excrementigallinarum TaxID=2838506 RepID=A0A9D1ZV93_9FIRM|nr:recombinase family protein [Candidatus Borkfalkia excrementigallinarum]